MPLLLRPTAVKGHATTFHYDIDLAKFRYFGLHKTLLTASQHLQIATLSRSKLATAWWLATAQMELNFDITVDIIEIFDI